MEKQARLVIIGAGIVGCSAAYHLTKMGWKDIVVLDQGKAPFYGGSSSHAPGGAFQTNPSKLMTELAHYGAHFYHSLEYDGKKGAELTGGIELARTPERLTELKRRRGLGYSWGLEGEILTPKECKEKVPFLNEKEILGGYFVADDAIGRPVVCVQALADFAKKNGVKFYDRTDVLDILVEKKRVKGIKTNNGTIACEKILCCAGMWGPVIGEMIGQPMPLMPMEHQYARTNSLKALEPFKDTEIALPMLREQDHSLYFRQHHQEWGIGNYFHRPLPIKAEKLAHPSQSKEMPSIRQWTPADFKEAWDRSAEIFPCLKEEKAELTYKINGVFSFTPDSGSLLGESPVVKDFWIAEAVWYTHAAGFAKIIAEWMDAGEPQQDVHEADLHRFYGHSAAKKYIRNAGAEQYRVVYDLNHPKRQNELERNLMCSPFFERQQQLGGHFFQTLGFERAHWYESNRHLLDYNFAKRHFWSAQNWSPIEAVESLQTRNNAAIYDLSAFQVFEVEGSGALDFLQKQVCSNLDVAIGRIVYTQVLTVSGGIKCDVTISRMDEDLFWVISGVGSAGHDFATLKNRLEVQAIKNVSLRDISDSYATIGVWGPNAKKILQPIADIDLNIQDFRFFRWKSAFLGSIPVYMFRISYVGESGWEIYVKNPYALALWKLIEKAGAPYGMVPAGTGAFDSLRIEKAYRSWGGDMAQNETPFHAGTEFIISWKKGEFIGKEALEKVKKEGVDLRLHTFRLQNKTTVLLGGETLYDKNHRRIGYVTSANYGYAINESIGFAYLPPEYGKVGTEVYFDYLGNMCRGFIEQDVLYDPKYEKVKI